MSQHNVVALRSPGALSLHGRRSRARRLHDNVWAFLSQGNVSFERTLLIVRPAIAIVVGIAVMLPGSTLPGRTGVVIACAIAVVYNVPLAACVFTHRVQLLRASSIVLDNCVVIAASLHVFMRMGAAGYESDLWLIYISLIVIDGLYYGPVGSILFTALWTGLFVCVSLFFYGGGTYFAEQMPTRLVFFLLTGFVALSLAAELRQRREKLERQTRQTLTMLATIVEARDSDAGLHLRHIQHYSRALAVQLGIDELTASEIAYAAMIHDVGKARVVDAILKKPGPLTTPERAEMQKHTVWGDELLAQSEEFGTARQVARAHHERWDGSGYPDGVAGESIPLAARIVAVADVYDALISERPYKAAWPVKQAIAEIRSLRGSHLDPVVVDAFLELYESGALRELEREMRDQPHAHDLGETLAA